MSPFESSSHIEPLKLSQKPFFHGLAGVMQSLFTPTFVSRSCTVFRYRR